MSAPRQRKPTRESAQPNTPQQSGAPELIDPRWLLRALGIVLAVALVCAYCTLCLLWYQGQWQLVLHPSRIVSTTPASVGLNFTALHFGVDNTGTPQLAGWYIPSGAANATTALLLHGADGSIADSLPRARTLHDAGLNVLLFDYRGYGASAGAHPSEDSMQADAASALNWLMATQHVQPASIVLYGAGVGASLAVTVAAQHREIAAVILDAPDGDLTARAAQDPRSRLAPARLLFNQTFPLAAPLRTLTTPKLLISYGESAPAALADAADPKTTLELSSPNDPALVAAIQRFVDEYAHASTR